MSATGGVAFLGALGDGCSATVAAVLVVGVLLLAAVALITSAIVVRRLARWEATLATPVPFAGSERRSAALSPEKGDTA